MDAETRRRLEAMLMRIAQCNTRRGCVACVNDARDTLAVLAALPAEPEYGAGLHEEQRQRQENTMANGRTVGERKAVAKLKAAWTHVNEKRRSDADKLEVIIPEPVWADLEAAVTALVKDDAE